MGEALKCILMFAIAAGIAGAYQLTARGIYRSSLPMSKRIAAVSLAAGLSFAAMVGVPAWTYRAQRGWDPGTVLALVAGAFLLSGLGLFLASWFVARRDR